MSDSTNDPGAALPDLPPFEVEILRICAMGLDDYRDASEAIDNLGDEAMVRRLSTVEALIRVGLVDADREATDLGRSVLATLGVTW